MEDTKGVAFDLGDVLLDTEPDLDWLYRAFWKTLAEYGINSSQENLQKIHSKNLQEIVDFFIKEFNYGNLFDFGIGRGSKLKNFKELKPSAYSLERLRDIVKYNKLIYVGDSEKDREFAESTGIEFIFPSRKRDEGFNSLNKVVDYLLP